MYIVYHFTGKYHWILPYWDNFDSIDDPMSTGAVDRSYWLVPGTYEED